MYTQLLEQPLEYPAHEPLDEPYSHDGGPSVYSRLMLNVSWYLVTRVVNKATIPMNLQVVTRNPQRNLSPINTRS